MGAKPLVAVDHIVKNFSVAGGKVSALDGVSFSIDRGETLALVGESGCGKSTLGRIILWLLAQTSGTVLFDGMDLSSLSSAQLRKQRKRMQMVFQDPFSSLDPRITIGKIIEEPIRIHRLEPDKRARKERVCRMMEKVGIRPEYYDRYPHQFSGGQRQRIGIAHALSADPEFVVCDEAVSALDVSVQAQILNLLKELQDEFHLTYLFISHDLSVVRYLSNRICVMFLGRICEIGNTPDVYEHPRHPYTQLLLDSYPVPDPLQRSKKKALLVGEPPSPLAPLPGCRFHTRCPYAKPECSKAQPPMMDLGNGHYSACPYR